MTDGILKNIFTNLEDALASNAKIKIGHNLEDGKYREHLVKVVLEKILPSKYSITNGFIIDSNNRRSQEMDIIIYDKSYVPPFFDETYSIVPVEAVLAVIQVKTTLDYSSLKKSVNNLNSIDKLVTKKGGSIISADGCKTIREKRYIKPYKIIVANKCNRKISQDKYHNALNTIDIIYVVDNSGPLFIKHKAERGVVNKSKKELNDSQISSNIEFIKDDKLLSFSLHLLDKIKLINNSMIINYKDYIKGVK